MKLCVFQGTFNPIHNAHIRLAKYALNKYNFDKLLFIPAYKPPHKECNCNAAIDRLNMAKIAISDENEPKFEVSDIEYQREEKSYTYLTICKLYEIYKPTGKIWFIIGTDAFDNIESWYKANELKKLVKFIVFPRENNVDFDKYDFLKLKGYDYVCENLSFKNISSTDLREKIIHSESIDTFINNKVKEYIEKNELYKDYLK